MLRRLTFFATVVCVDATPGSSQQVVENPAPNVNVPSFRLSAQPLFTVGGLNDNRILELLAVDAVAIDTDGGLMVAPARTAVSISEVAVRQFDSTGKFVRQYGRVGQGPGEFMRVGAIVPVAKDSLFVYDQLLNRVTTFASGAVRVTGVPRMLTAICCTRHADFLIAPRDPARPVAGAPQSIVPDTVVVSVANAGSAEVVPRAVTRLQGREPRLNLGTDNLSNGETVTEFFPRPFATNYFLRASGERFVYSNNDAFEYRVFLSTGQLVRTVRAALPPIPVSRSTADSVRDEFCAAISSKRRADCERVAQQMAIRQAVPAITAIVAERDGSVWLQGHELTRSGRRWLAAFDPNGHLLGVLHVPADQIVRAIESDRILLEYVDRIRQVTFLYMYRVERAR